MSAAWVYFVVLGVILQSIGLICYYLSEKQRREMEAATAASEPLRYVISIDATTESLPGYVEFASAPPPPSYEVDMASLPTRPLPVAAVIIMPHPSEAPPAYPSLTEQESTCEIDLSNSHDNSHRV